MKHAIAAVTILTALILAACPLTGTGTGGGTDTVQYASNVSILEGTIYTTRTLAAGSVYLVTSAVYIQNGASLIASAGAILKFTSEGAIRIESGGQIIANGTSSSPVIFTSYRDSSAGGDSILNDADTAPARGDWHQLWIYSGSTGNSLSHCEFRYGGADSEAVLSIDGTASVDSCSFHSNLGGYPGVASQEACLDAADAGSGTTITNSVFYKNGWPLAIGSNLSLDSSNSFSYDDDGNSATAALTNDYPAVYIADRGVSATVSWLENEVAFCYLSNNALYVNAPAGNLIIGPDVTVKFSGAYCRINVESGALFTPNTSASFSSFRNDALKGDSNADGSASSPSVGDWEGIYLDASSSWYTTRVTYASHVAD